MDRNLIAEQFSARMAGRLDQQKIDTAVRAIRTTTTAYPASGSVASLIQYLTVEVQIQNGKEFNGVGGPGATSPFGAAMYGYVHTEDLSRLYAKTEMYEILVTSMYASIMFFDGDANFLGYFGSGALTIESGSAEGAVGVYGGKGSWS
ncbi:VapA/VapB family virulence-associated protein [Myceligenerans indicum]|uniref:VapA/VapB family virulence-associated protein n=1 Tax=Myceligenerans indicum TaxID=2593663 RepID=A0ABS1LR15_9MICO|nr:VapA/VapB family virulence-associated protein [Myceligenerans indicum]MBL0888742.1 VapA/VapB family virulence-associated protein [Myceligenerans indicum]